VKKKEGRPGLYKRWPGVKGIPKNPKRESGVKRNTTAKVAKKVQQGREVGT